MPDATSPQLNEPLRSYDECRRDAPLTRREMSVLRSIRANRGGRGYYTLRADEISTGYSRAVFYGLLRGLRDKGMIDTWTADGAVCVKMKPEGFLRSAP